MHKNLCHGKKGPCDAMRPTKGTELLQYLRNVEFEGEYLDNYNFQKLFSSLIKSTFQKCYSRFKW